MTTTSPPPADATATTYSATDGLTLTISPVNGHVNGTASSRTPTPEPDQTLTIPPVDLICALPISDTAVELVHLDGPNDSRRLTFRTLRNAPASFLERYLLPHPPAHLSKSECDLTVLLSTASGAGRAVDFHSQYIAPLFTRLQLDHAETVRTTSPTSIADVITTLASAARPQTLLLLSGDTGIHDAINALPRGPHTPITLCVFPLGSGNALASSLHTSRNISPLSALLLGTPHPLPTFTATFSPRATLLDTGAPVEELSGAVVVSWGLHAALVADSEALRESHPSDERFRIAAEQNLNPPHAYRGTLTILPPGPESTPRKIPRDEHMYVVATMCSNLEAAFRISPGSTPGEGVIRVVHFGVMEKEEVLQLMGGAYVGGRHVDDERVGYEVARGVMVEVGESEERWRRVCVDGRTVQVEEGGRVEMRVDEGEAGRGARVVWMD